MSYTGMDLLQAAQATLAFAVLLLPFGYLGSHLTAIATSSRSSAPVQLLWSVSLSLPLALACCGLAGPWLSAGALHLGILLVGMAALLLLGFRFSRTSTPRAVLRRSTVALTSALVLGFVAYLLFATVSLQIGSHLFEPVSIADWSVRVPLVGASIRDGIPPRNPFFTVSGQSQPARYYFFWYSLCAQIAQLAQVPPRAALAGSVVWSALTFVTTLFLCVKHLVGTRRSLPGHCLLAASLCFVMGVDILPTLAGLLTRPIHLTPEIEWWHADRIPSFLGAFAFAPHHIAGLVSAALGVLILSLCPFPAGNVIASSATRPWVRTASAILLAGTCFAATAGVSSYIALCFAVIGTVFGIFLLLQRRWIAILALVMAGGLAFLLCLPLLHSLLAPAGSPATPVSGHLLRFTLRDLHDGDRAVTFLSKRLHHRVTNRKLMHLLALPFVALSLPLEFGFFLVPLTLKFRQDLHRLKTKSRFSTGEQALWAMFLGALLPALFLSSEPTQGVNDLGRHAGLILRFVAVLWSAQVLFPYAERLRRRQPLLAGHPSGLSVWTKRTAVVLLVLGLLTQTWQIVADRLYLLVFDRTHCNPEMPFAKDDDLSGRYFDLRRGLDQVESRLPAHAVVQSNMGSRYQLPVMLYSQRPFAAGDVSCEIAFGGSPALCSPIVHQLEQLFGGPPDMQPIPLGPYVTVTAADAVQTTTPAVFRQACHDQHLAAVVAQNSDPAWSIPGSWVWQLTPAYATPRVRIFLCPAVPDL